MVCWPVLGLHLLLLLVASLSVGWTMTPTTNLWRLRADTNRMDGRPLTVNFPLNNAAPYRMVSDAYESQGNVIFGRYDGTSTHWQVVSMSGVSNRHAGWYEGSNYYPSHFGLPPISSPVSMGVQVQVKCLVQPWEFTDLPVIPFAASNVYERSTNWSITVRGETHSVTVPGWSSRSGYPAFYLPTNGIVDFNTNVILRVILAAWDPPGGYPGAWRYWTNVYFAEPRDVSVYYPPRPFALCYEVYPHTTTNSVAP